MAGNTGKMTREAVAARGPRTVLGRPTQDGPLVIFTDGYKFGGRIGYSYYVIAKSYSLGYLLKVAGAWK